MNESVNAEAMSHKRGAKYQLDYEHRQRGNERERETERGGNISVKLCEFYANFVDNCESRRGQCNCEECEAQIE